MTAPNDPTIPQDSIDAVIAAYLEAVDAGRSPDRQELLNRYPRHAEQLRSFFADHDRMNQAAAPLRLRETSDSSSDAASSPGGALPRVRYFGDYELLEEIARGGMGIVYKGRQVSLHRIVALKMILAGQFASETEVQRFYAEARSAANLQHPNIVAIHEVGQHEGQHYFSMDYIEGKSLAQIVRENPLPAEKAAGYLKTITEAIEFAHRQGTLHRDLKPSNVVIDRFDQPRITDFGLAKRIEGTAQITATGPIAGTPSYMPPEQAGAYDGKASPASDVYSLGALLYDLLTGRPPFLGENLVVTLNQVLNAEPVAPRLLSPEVPHDLETICLKCLEKDPQKRYPSAAALADDLGHFLRHEPIAARPVSQWERGWRWCKRNRTVSSLSATIVALLLLAAIGGSVLAIRERSARESSDENALLAERNAGMATAAAEEAKDEARRADASAAEARQSADRLSVDDGLRLAEQGDFYEALRRFVRPLRNANKMSPAEERMHRVRIGTYLRYGQGRSWLTHIFFSPIKKPFSLHSNSLSVGLKFSPDCSRLLAVGDTDLCVWDLGRDQLAGPILHHSGAISHVRFTSDGRRLRVSDGIKAWTWDYSTGATVGALLSDPQIVPARPKKERDTESVMAFNSDATRLAVAAGRLCRVWNVEKAVPLSAPIHCPYVIESFGFSPDGKRIAVGGAPRDKVSLWDTNSGNLVAEIPCIGGAGSDSIEFSVGGKYLITSNSSHYRLWNPQTGKAETPLNFPQHYPQLTWAGFIRPESYVGEFEFAKNGERGLLVVDPMLKVPNNDDYAAFVFDTRTGKAAGPPLRHPTGFLATTFSPDGSVVLASDLNRMCRLWDVRTGRPITAMLPHSGIVDSCVFAPSGRQFATADRNGQIRVWELGVWNADKELQRFSSAKSSFEDGAVTRSIVGAHASYSASVNVMEVRSPEITPEEKAQIARLPQAPKGARQLEILSPNAKRAFRVTRPVYEGEKIKIPGGASLWELGQVVREIPLADQVSNSRASDMQKNLRFTTCAAFTPDSRRLATADTSDTTMRSEYTVCLWDAETGKLLGHPQIFPLAVNCVTPDANGSRWAVATVDGLATIWDLERGLIIGQPMKHQTSVLTCAFEPDNSLLASLDGGGGLNIWETANARPVLPPLDTSGLQTTHFNSAGTKILFPVSRRAFDIHPDSHSTAELVRLIELISCQRETSAGLISLTQSDIRDDWNDLRARFPDTFRVPTEAILQWHEGQIASARAVNEPAAVAFQRHCLAAELGRVGWRPDADATTELEFDRLCDRLCALAANSRAPEATVAAGKLALKLEAADNLLKLSHVFALAAADHSQPKDQIANDVNESIHLLRSAVQIGLPPDLDFKMDSDFASLHDWPDFEQIVRDYVAKKKVVAETSQ